ncbi:MAG: hypothetical protein AB1744_08820 [Candidatus Zixiibacteriota bacterium]
MREEKPSEITDEELRNIKRRKPTKKEEKFRQEVEDQQEEKRKLILHIHRQLEKLENS